DHRVSFPHPQPLEPRARSGPPARSKAGLGRVHSARVQLSARSVRTWPRFTVWPCFSPPSGAGKGAMSERIQQMRLNSKLTWGLAWAGLAVVLVVPSADYLTGQFGGKARTAAL